MKKHLLALLLTLIVWPLAAQQRYELNAGWLAQPIAKVPVQGPQLSQPAYPLTGWLPAVVPGTVLTTQLTNKQVPDPFFGMNNQRIPDIYRTGPGYYTYWFVRDFQEAPASGTGQVWLHLRGVNYSCEVYLNGQKLNQQTHRGMFLRQAYNITPHLAPDGRNRLAVLVYPPDPVGNPNGGQAGDGTIARNVAHQYVAGWDWIQPIRDRNTGIWDKVTIEKTGAVNLRNPHIITRVPGLRKPTGPQPPALLDVTAELENPTEKKVTGTLQYTIDGQTVRQKVTLPARATQLVRLPTLTLSNPKLWWPNGYGAQPLYASQLQFLVGKTVSDAEEVTVGVREIQREWNARTQSMQVLVNGQRIFIKGGNWIISDALLRFSDARYDAEIRFHRDMNLNLIRVWGGALVERPEFYRACDQYGLLVMQDFWMTGDANGRWVDPLKLDDQYARRQYPQDHGLFLRSAADQVKLVRNHASLAIWCGGNEITPPRDILTALQDSILPQLDGTRWFVPYSNADSMSMNTLGGGGDGPYTIQPIGRFWSQRTYPFNSEVGSVGVGDVESLERFLPAANLVPPRFTGTPARPAEQVDSVWDYHKYIGYENYLLPYGAPTDARDFGRKAQLVNYEQYRALMEGFSAHMWDWYTGSIIWKTQNPWTALRGQMYDYYLDPNACLYGLRTGSEPLHVQYNPVDSVVMLTNNGFEVQRDLMLEVDAYDMAGQKKSITQVVVEINPSMSKKYLPINGTVRQLAREKGMFLSLQLLNLSKQPVSQNLYWLPDAKGEYSGLKTMPKAALQVVAKSVETGKVEVVLTNPAGAPVAFFNRLALVNPATQKRILPVFYSDNYVSVLPGKQKTVLLDYTPTSDVPAPVVAVEGWNVVKQLVPVALK
ncbi:glycoside hydrolase family 2 TIM barrel-domain containing protein [Hymenobacter endophyticus]|uniref:Glycoside hydrolase family 2 TIM barrel-domain containing protein n=1 Tax=Hymenobacter endophyticus TaxID=3076335 RepID=A0ABU3TN74_9BACT|nr:glycoside hydrolase family 2 TIM barrel-domain containing protein [Hymenobacter endophyticus]MDU0372846.1 glycoside hydrolase family 2 TIM barrel-domain containing protein [Hymenobacter endophyticus]